MESKSYNTEPVSSITFSQDFFSDDSSNFKHFCNRSFASFAINKRKPGTKLRSRLFSEKSNNTGCWYGGSPLGFEVSTLTTKPRTFLSDTTSGTKVMRLVTPANGPV